MYRQAAVERRVSSVMSLPKLCYLSLVVTGLCIPAVAGLTINEILADPASGLQGDANGDGMRSGSADEFIEIVYDTPGADLDLTGWTLSDATRVRHVFPAGSVLASYSALVVFGGGSPTGSFGGGVIQTASSGGLGLNNTSDTVALSDGAGFTITVDYGSEAGDNQSLTRDPDLIGPFTRHMLAVHSGGTRFSPGTMTDGRAFGSTQGGSDSDSDPAPTPVPVPGALVLASLGLWIRGLRRW